MNERNFLILPSHGQVFGFFVEAVRPKIANKGIHLCMPLHRKINRAEYIAFLFCVKYMIRRGKPVCLPFICI
jgi:hypothetical protein